MHAHAHALSLSLSLSHTHTHTHTHTQELAGGEKAAGPRDLKCPLTGNLFEDPVIAPSGHTYERAAILEHLQKQGGKDPITRQPLSVEQLTPNRAMKALVEQYRKGASRVAF